MRRGLKCLKSITDTVNIKSSILNAFGTFLLLLYGKFLTVSFDLLIYTREYAPNGKAGGYVLFYDATIEYFGRDNLPYAILAIVIILLFNILPLLFALLHPLRCFRGCTAKWPALRICLDFTTKMALKALVTVASSLVSICLFASLSLSSMLCSKRSFIALHHLFCCVLSCWLLRFVHLRNSLKYITQSMHYSLSSSSHCFQLP